MRTRPTVRLLLLLVSLIHLPALPADEIRILLLKSSSSDTYSGISSGIIESTAISCRESKPVCPSYTISETVVTADGDHSPVDPKRFDLVITLGPAAARLLARGDNRLPVINGVISRIEYRDLYGYSGRKHLRAVYIDQPLRRFFTLAKLVLGRDFTAGLLLGPNTREERAVYQEIGLQESVPLIIRMIDDDEVIGPTLKDLLGDVDVLLTVPDPFLYNRKTIFNILLSSYNAHVPVIGFSEAYVKAGALTAVYSSPADISRDLSEMLHDYLSTGELGASRYPRHFSVTVNTSVAQSLDMRVPDAGTLKHKLIEIEHDQF